MLLSHSSCLVFVCRALVFPFWQGIKREVIGRSRRQLRFPQMFSDLSNLGEAISNIAKTGAPENIDRKALEDYVSKNPVLEKIANKVLRDPRQVIRPGFTVRCKGSKVDGVDQYFVNIAQTLKLKQSDDDTDVAIIVSDVRSSSAPDYGRYHVVDCVVHQRICAKAEVDPGYRAQLIDMCFNCVTEVQQIQIDKRRSYTVITATYMEPFGWNEEGQPISGDEAREETLEELFEMDAPIEAMTPSDLLQNLSLNEEKQNPPSEIEENPIKAPLIEEIGAMSEVEDYKYKRLDDYDVTLAHPSEDECIPLLTDQDNVGLTQGEVVGSEISDQDRDYQFEAEYTVKRNSKYTIRVDVLLPNISSGSQAECFIVDRSAIYLRTLDGVYGLKRELDLDDYDLVSTKFSRARKILRITFERCI